MLACLGSAAALLLEDPLLEVLIGPELNQSQRGPRNVAEENPARFDFDKRFVLAVDRVEVWRRVVA